MPSTSAPTTTSAPDLVDEPLGLAREIASNVLERAEATGPAEVFAVRSRLLVVAFEDLRLSGAEHVERQEIALRLVLGGRVGLSAASLPHGREGVADLTARARAAAHLSQPSGLGPNAPVRSKTASLATGVSATALVSLAQELGEELRDSYPGFHWRGRIVALLRRGVVLNTGGTEAESLRRSFAVDLRALGSSERAPIDRRFRVMASHASELAPLIRHRIQSEFPPGRADASADKDAPLAVGPELVARSFESLARGSWRPTGMIDPHLHVVDDPMLYHDGADEEGVPVGPLPLIRPGGHLERWAVRAGSGKHEPVGRGFRPSIEAPPWPRALGLRWWVPLDARWPRRVRLLRELSGLRMTPDGVVSGLASETILSEEGRAVGRAAGGQFQFSLSELLRPGVTASNDIYAADHHRLPNLCLRRR